MSTMLVNQKLMYFRYVGATPLVLNSTNAAWINKVVKLTKLSLRNSTTGLNTRQTFAGSYNGATAGGAMTTLEVGQGYELTAGLYDGSWSLPDAFQVVEIPVDSTVLTLFFPGSQTNFPFPAITIGSAQAGTYALPTVGTGLNNVTYTKNGQAVSGTVTLPANDVLVVTGSTTTVGTGTLVLTKQ